LKPKVWKWNVKVGNKLREIRIKGVCIKKTVNEEECKYVPAQWWSLAAVRANSVMWEGWNEGGSSRVCFFWRQWVNKGDTVQNLSTCTHLFFSNFASKQKCDNLN